MFCSKCGAENNDASLYCTACGKRLKEVFLHNESFGAPRVSVVLNDPLRGGDEPLSRKTKEDREALHTYLVTPLSDFNTPLERGAHANNVKTVVSSLIGGVTGHIVGTIAGSIVGNFLNSNGVVSGSSVVDTDIETTKREALFQQQQILQLATGYSERAPWITYLVAVKCAPFLRHFGIATDSFPDLKDKQAVDATERYADQLESASYGMLSDEDKRQIHRLFFEEGIEPQLQEAVKIIADIENSRSARRKCFPGRWATLFAF